MEEIKELIRICDLLQKNYVENLDQVILKAVVDVINRFIKIINPKTYIFGEKDMQQLKILEDF